MYKQRLNTSSDKIVSITLFLLIPFLTDLPVAFVKADLAGTSAAAEVGDCLGGVNGIPSNGLGTENERAVASMLAADAVLSPPFAVGLAKELPLDTHECDDAVAVVGVEYWIGRKSLGMINP